MRKKGLMSYRHQNERHGRFTVVGRGACFVTPDQTGYLRRGERRARKVYGTGYTYTWYMLFLCRVQGMYPEYIPVFVCCFASQTVIYDVTEFSFAWTEFQSVALIGTLYIISKSCTRYLGIIRAPDLYPSSRVIVFSYHSRN